MTTASPLQPACDTKQQRSRETLERILDAAEQILDERDFSELTMADLARRAGCAVGTLYGRLPNKESLLVCLHERYLSAGISESEAALAPCQGGSLEVLVQALCSMAVKFFAEHRGVTRAITVHLFDRLGADAAGFRLGATARIRQVAAMLAEKVDRRVHPDPQQACEFAVLTMSEMAQSRIVFVDRSAVRIRYSRKQLEGQLAALVTAYLRDGGRQRSAGATASKRARRTGKNKRKSS